MNSPSVICRCVQYVATANKSTVPKDNYSKNDTIVGHGSRGSRSKYSQSDALLCLHLYHLSLEMSRTISYCEVLLWSFNLQGNGRGCRSMKPSHDSESQLAKLPELKKLWRIFPH